MMTAARMAAGVRSMSDDAGLPDLTQSEWGPFILREYSFSEFPKGSLVLDVGCGEGSQLAALTARGCVAVGADVSSASLAWCRERALKVVQARAEELPIRTGVLDGVVCKVALPYTLELTAVAEIARVLKPGGRAILCSHAVGYYVRYMLFSPTARRLFYSLRTFLNTWLYISTRRRFPRFLGDTLYQSRGRLYRYYRENKLSVVCDYPAPKYLELPVFLYHEVIKNR